MKTNIQKATLFTTLLAAGLLLAAGPAQATNYAGNGNTGFGGPVGNGVLSVTDDHTNITVNLQRGSSGNLNDCLVIYIDTGTGGYADTSTLTDTGGTEQKAISGYSGSQRSIMTFTNGFRPSYAIAIKSDFMDVWNIANPSGFSFLAGVGGYTSSSANYTLTFAASQIGLAPNVSTNIRMFGTYISASNPGYRSTEAIAGNDVSSGNVQGFIPFTNTVFATYIFAAPVAPTNPVTFSVDMTAQFASGAFNPTNGDAVYVGGSFEAAPFAFNLHLTNNMAAANTNIYSGTYPDQDLTNTMETYKFKFYSVANNADTYDADPNRTFALQGGGQVLPLIYFNNTPASPSATTNYITFQIDMGPQIYLTHFSPAAGDQIQVSGGFQSPQFSAGIVLTNDPSLSGNASNIYSGTVADYNYPGTQYLPPQNGYKFVIVTSASTTNYESGSNRSLVTPTNSVTLPVAYFNGISTYAAIPITFSVDMTVPIAVGMFNPGNSDTVGCAGTFETNQWTVGTVNSFILTNDPAAANTNIYSGTYIDRNAPGTVEQYKFVINTNGGGTAYEQPTISTISGNRYFLLGSTASTNPLVFWSDQDPNNILLVPTDVTFTVNMTNAVDIYGGAFVPSSDVVIINGNFTTPAWYSWTDATLGTDYPQYRLANNPIGSTFYTGTYTMPAGSSLEVVYKYGIIHNYSDSGNTNADLEAGYAMNHTRYIRATGTYTFPTDIFGMQVTNQAAATEQQIMNLSIGTPTAGQLPISWMGLPGTHLQYTTNLVNSVWVDLDDTTGTSGTNWPQTNGSAFFRVVLP